MNLPPSPARRAPAVSILMPVRNAASTLAEAIHSITTQSLTDWELIVIDDGSTDATPAILNQAAGADPRIQIERTPPLGIVAALNHGIAMCRAPWIARMDADDRMAPDRLAIQLAHARENPDLGVVSGLVTHGGSTGGFAEYIDWLNAITTPDQIAARRFIESPVAHPSVMFRRALIECHGGYRSGDFPEDYELWLRWLGAGVRFGKAPHPILTWNDAPGRLTRRDPRYLPEKFYQTKLPHLATWLRQNVDPAREIWLWGAGRVTRKRFAPLAGHGIRLTGFIDIDPNKCGHRRDHLRVVLPPDMPAKSDAFIIAGVAKRGARELIQADLEARGFIETADFIHAA